MRISALFLATSVLIAFVIWVRKGRPESFITWLIPKRVYTHSSNLLDIKLFLANRAFITLGLFGALFFGPAVTFYTISALIAGTGGTYSAPPITWLGSLIATLMIVVMSDFCKYWSHRIQHEWKSLWPFHAVHHSADVLTPLTVQRIHPVELIVRDFIISFVVGIIQGIVLFAIIGELSLLTIAGANAVYFIFNALGSNLRHSHIWLSYGWFLEHIFISPAQHQIHHSVAKKHHDKNYGSIFALWDWAFGTLYIPETEESLVFGVSDAVGKPQEQPYKTLSSALLKPFAQSWSVFAARDEPEQPADTELKSNL